MRMLSFRRAASVYVAFLDTLAGALSEHGPRAEANDAAAATVLGMLDAMAHASCVMSAHIARKSALGSTLHRTRAGRLPSPQRRI